MYLYTYNIVNTYMKYNKILCNDYLYINIYIYIYIYYVENVYMINYYAFFIDGILYYIILLQYIYIYMCMCVNINNSNLYE